MVKNQGILTKNWSKIKVFKQVRPTSDLRRTQTRASRFGFSDYQIKNAFQQGITEALIKIVQLDSAGVEIVVYFTWPVDTVKNISVEFERIPIGADRDTVFYYLGKFLIVAGLHIDWIKID